MAVLTAVCIICINSMLFHITTVTLKVQETDEMAPTAHGATEQASVILRHPAALSGGFDLTC